MGAELTERKVENSEMESPQAADEVSIYESFFPKTQVVLAGHLNFAGSGAVFTDLEKLRMGDEVVLWKDGTRQVYRILSNETRPLIRLDVMEFVNRASWFQAMTIITCAGVFDPAIETYDARRFVQAARVE